MLSTEDLIKSWSDRNGAGHFKYQQMVGGIPVFGRQLIVHLDGGYSVYSLNGRFEPSPQGFQTVPAITEEEALESVRQHLGRPEVNAKSIDLMVYTRPDNEMVLTYKLEVVPSLSEGWTYFIDANNGQFVHRITKIRNEMVEASGRAIDSSEDQTFNAWHGIDGNYYMVDPSMPDPVFNEDIDYIQNIVSPGNTYILSTNNSEGGDLYHVYATSPLGTWDPAGVSAMVNIRTVYQYYFDTFERNGLDGNNVNYTGVIHWGYNYNNAFFMADALENGDPIMAFGDGDGINFSGFAKSLDIAALELQHGITAYEAELIYENQSGALNEAYSDLFACMVDDDDWRIGEDITLMEPEFVRDLADPTQGIEPLPTHMDEYRHMPNTEEGDWGGVHINMSIPSHAGYLMAEGLENNIGRERTARIWYDALTNCLTSASEFEDARRCTIEAAEAEDPSAVAVVQRAWNEVGVYDNTMTPVGLIFSSQSLNFPDISVGAHSTQTLTLRNSSERDINISSITLDGSSNFTHNGNTGPLLSNDEMEIEVTYTPERTGSESATLSIVSDADIPTDSISITGNAISNNDGGGSSSGSGGCMIYTLSGDIKSSKAALAFLPLGFLLLLGAFIKEIKKG
jgi:Zn-dependent metalloprotease